MQKYVDETLMTSATITNNVIYNNAVSPNGLYVSGGLMDKEQLLKRADELLKFVLDGLESGKELASEQAPLLVKEVITWGIVEHAIYLVIGAFFMGLCLGLARLAYKKCDADEPIFLIPLCVSVIGFIMVCSNTLTIAKAYFAPRLYLLEQLRSLLH
jgi:hypothetical protein